MIPTRIVRITDRRLAFIQNRHQVWTSTEGDNPGRSIKDRMVFAELNANKNHFCPETIVSEVSAGSTAVSLAFFAKLFKLNCSLFVPNTLSQDKKDLLTELEAKLFFCNIQTAYSDYEAYCSNNPSVWRLNQMRNGKLRSHYRDWAATHLAPHLPPITSVIGAIGTGHSVLGVASGLGSSPITAELSAGNISGIRNIELERYGDNDPCEIGQFSRRMVISMNEIFHADYLETDQGEIRIFDSFKVAIGALEKLLEGAERPQHMFAVGADSRFNASVA